MKCKYEAKVTIEANVRGDEEGLPPIDSIKEAFLGNGVTGTLMEILLEESRGPAEIAVKVEKLYASVCEEVNGENETR